MGKKKKRDFDYFKQFHQNTERMTAARQQPFAEENPGNSWRHRNNYRQINNYEPNWQYPRQQRTHWGPVRNTASRFYAEKRKRSPSPKAGSVEYMEKKIEKMSTNIMQQLMNPESNNSPKELIVRISHTETKSPITSTITSTQSTSSSSTSQSAKKDKKVKLTPNKNQSLDKEVIQEKIVSHLVNLREGRKKNIINSTSSGYDVAIEKIVQQKRLELSRVVRHVCSQANKDMASENLFSIIPDMGIKLEDLPEQCIDELNRALNLNELENENFGSQTNEDVLKEEPEDDEVLLNMLDNIINQLNSNSSVIKPAENPKPINFAEPISYVKQEKEDVIDTNENIVEKPLVPESIIQTDTFFIPPVNIKQEKLDNDDDDDDDDDNVQQYEIQQEAIEIKSETMEENDFEKDNDTDDEDDLTLIETNENNSIEVGDTIENKSAPQTQSVMIQTRPPKYYRNFMNETLETVFKTYPQTLGQAIRRGRLIDSWIESLMQYRQSMLTNLKKIENNKKKRTKVRNQTNTVIESNANKKSCEDLATTSIEERLESTDVFSKIDKKLSEVPGQSLSCNDKQNVQLENIRNTKEIDEEERSALMKEKFCYLIKIALSQIEKQIMEKLGSEKMCIVKTIEDKLLLAVTNVERVVVFNLCNAKLIQIKKLDTCPVKSVECLRKGKKYFAYFLLTDGSLKGYDVTNNEIFQHSDVTHRVYCMAPQWNYLFLGCTGGWFLRYSLKKNAVECKDRFCGNTILDIKPTIEGARKVIIVATMGYPVCIRDAMTGLHLRTLNYDYANITFNMIFVDDRFLYCSGLDSNIFLFSFHDGRVARRLQINRWTRKSFITHQNLLFLNTYSEHIFVYNTDSGKMVHSISHPDDKILHMDIIYNHILIATASSKFKLYSLKSIESEALENDKK